MTKKSRAWQPAPSQEGKTGLQVDYRTAPLAPWIFSDSNTSQNCAASRPSLSGESNSVLSRCSSRKPGTGSTSTPGSCTFKTLEDKSTAIQVIVGDRAVVVVVVVVVE